MEVSLPVWDLKSRSTRQQLLLFTRTEDRWIQNTHVCLACLSANRYRRVLPHNITSNSRVALSVSTSISEAPITQRNLMLWVRTFFFRCKTKHSSCLLNLFSIVDAFTITWRMAFPPGFAVQAVDLKRFCYVPRSDSASDEKIQDKITAIIVCLVDENYTCKFDPRFTSSNSDSLFWSTAVCLQAWPEIFQHISCDWYFQKRPHMEMHPQHRLTCCISCIHPKLAIEMLAHLNTFVLRVSHFSYLRRGPHCSRRRSRSERTGEKYQI